MISWFRQSAPRSGLAERLRSGDAERLRRYREYSRWYEGQHWLQPRPGRSNLVANYCRAIVDKGVAYLLGRGLNFAVVPQDEGDPESRATANRGERLIYRVYWENDLPAVDLQVAINAAELGDGFYKVYWDVRENRIQVLCVDPFSVFVETAADDISRMRQVHLAYRLTGDGFVSMAPEYGLTEGHASVMVGRSRTVDLVESWTDREFAVTVGSDEIRRVPNPYGFIPFVHVPNLQPPNQFWGRSDLEDVIPLQREIDERLSDQADIIRYHADPPIIFRGVSEHSDLAVGPGSIWDIPSDADVKLLEWQGQPVAVQEHINMAFRALYEVAETPRTSFGDSGRLLSGVALETELRPIIQKTLRRQVYWTRALRARNRMILRLAERFGVDGAAAGLYAPYLTRVVWPPMVPSDDTADVNNNIALVGAGLRSHRTAMDRLGEEDPEGEIQRIQADREQLGTPGGGPGTGDGGPERPVGRPSEGRTGDDEG